MLIGLPRGVACATCAPGGHPRHLRGVADGWGEPPEAPALCSRWVGWSSGGSVMNNRWVGCATRRQLRVPHADREVAECALRVADSCMMPLLHPPKKKSAFKAWPTAVQLSNDMALGPFIGANVSFIVNIGALVEKNAAGCDARRDAMHRVSTTGRRVSILPTEVGCDHVYPPKTPPPLSGRQSFQLKKMGQSTLSCRNELLPRISARLVPVPSSSPSPME